MIIDKLRKHLTHELPDPDESVLFISFIAFGGFGIDLVAISRLPRLQKYSIQET